MYIFFSPLPTRCQPTSKRIAASNDQRARIVCAAQRLTQRPGAEEEEGEEEGKEGEEEEEQEEQEPRSRGAEGPRSRGAEEPRCRGAEEPRS